MTSKQSKIMWLEFAVSEASILLFFATEYREIHIWLIDRREMQYLWNMSMFMKAVSRFITINRVLSATFYVISMHWLHVKLKRLCATS